MDPESKKLLNDTFALAKDNNKMLHAIRRGQKWASFMRLVYWMIIIGISVGSFYFLQPYIESMKEIINSSIEGINSMKKLDTTTGGAGDSLKNINLDQFKNILNNQ